MVILDIKLFYKTQRDLALTLNSIINAYWENKISEEMLVKNVTDIYIYNPQKIIKQNDFTTILKQQCGKRRLEVVGRILHMNELLKDEQSAV